MHVQVEKEHQWLQKLVGEWTYEHESSMAPDQPPIKVTGTETVRSLGDVWVLCEAEGSMPGAGTHRSLMTLGYDPARKAFVGTFISSMMTYLWLYDGQLDASGRVLTLNSEGPSFTGEGMQKYQDVIEFVSDDHRLLKSLIPDENGQWKAFMTVHYQRKR